MLNLVTSGSGRSAKQMTHYPELYDNFKAYGVATHRHTPEIEQALGHLCHRKVTLNFTPHLVPMSRGILSTCYANIKQWVTPEMIDKSIH